MTRDEIDAVEALERAATMRDADPFLWSLVTRHRAGESLVVVLGEAVTALAEDHVPAGRVADEIRRLAEDAEHHAGEAEHAADEARNAAEDARRLAKRAGEGTRR